MLSRLRVSTKLLLIYALDMVAVVFLGFSLAEEKYIAINFARKEVAGNAYIEAVRENIFAALALGEARQGGEENIAAAVRAAAESLTAVKQAEARYGADTASAPQSDAAIHDGEVLLSAKPDAAEAALAQALASDRALISRIGDQSNLILDPDLDSYYTMSIILLRFPELVDLLTQMKSRVATLSGGDFLDRDQRSRFLILEGNLNTVITGLRQDLAASYGGNADGSLKAALGPSYQALDAALDNLLVTVRSDIIDRQSSIETPAVERALAAALNASHAAWRTSTVELGRLLQLRIDGFMHRMWAHFAMAGGLLAVILLLVLLVGRRIAVPIGHLAEVAEEVRRTNDYNKRAKWDSSDEIGRLVDSFNTMLQRLQEEGARREELAAQARAFAAQHELIDATPTPLTVTRLGDGALLHLNQPALDLLGLTTLDGAETYLSAADRDRLLQLLARHGAVSEFEAEVTGRAGSQFWALLAARRLTYQGEPAVLTTITPITERKRMEEELRGAKEKAEEALHQLQTAQQSLLQAEKMASLGGLVAGVAHEINTPVGIGLTGASTLSSETGKLRATYADGAMTEDDFLDYLSMAEATAQLLMSNMNRAADLIQSFKQVAVDQTSAERRRFNLGSYIDEILTSLTPTIKKHRHEVVVDCQGTIEVDGYPGAISQILTNLLMNALIHAFEENRSGRLSIAARLTDDDWVVLAFTDDGKGIPQDYLGRIFDPFFTTRRARGGSGLGLHIVYNLVVTSLHGTIEVASRIGEGTTFTIRFPRRAPQSQKPALAEVEG